MSDRLPSWAEGTRIFRLPETETRSYLENFFDGIMQQSGLARSAEEAVQRLRAFGAYAPAPVPGYNPYADPEELKGYEDSLHLFRDSQSPEETAFIKRRIDGMRQRARDLEQAGVLGQFIAGMLTPENLLLLPIGVGPLTATSRLGRAAQAGSRMAALNVVVAGGENMLAQQQLPASLQPDLAGDVALSALFGLVLGGFAGLVSGRSLERLARDFARAADAQDGQRTPGATARPRPAEAPERPPEAPERPAEAPERPPEAEAQRPPEAPPEPGPSLEADGLEVRVPEGDWVRVNSIGRFTAPAEDVGRPPEAEPPARPAEEAPPPPPPPPQPTAADIEQLRARVAEAREQADALFEQHDRARARLSLTAEGTPEHAALREQVENLRREMEDAFRRLREAEEALTAAMRANAPEGPAYLRRLTPEDGPEFVIQKMQQSEAFAAWLRLLASKLPEARAQVERYRAMSRAELRQEVRRLERRVQRLREEFNELQRRLDFEAASQSELNRWLEEQLDFLGRLREAEEAANAARGALMERALARLGVRVEPKAPEQTPPPEQAGRAPTEPPPQDAETGGQAPPAEERPAPRREKPSPAQRIRESEAFAAWQRLQRSADPENRQIVERFRNMSKAELRQEAKRLERRAERLDREFNERDSSTDFDRLSLSEMQKFVEEQTRLSAEAGRAAELANAARGALMERALARLEPQAEPEGPKQPPSAEPEPPRQAEAEEPRPEERPAEERTSFEQDWPKWLSEVWTAEQWTPREIHEAMRAENDFAGLDLWNLFSIERAKLLGGPDLAAFRALVRRQEPEEIARVKDYMSRSSDELVKRASFLAEQAGKLERQLEELLDLHERGGLPEPLARTVLEEIFELYDDIEKLDLRRLEVMGAARVRMAQEKLKERGEIWRHPASFERHEPRMPEAEKQLLRAETDEPKEPLLRGEETPPEALKGTPQEELLNSEEFRAWQELLESQHFDDRALVSYYRQLPLDQLREYAGIFERALRDLEKARDLLLPGAERAPDSKDAALLREVEKEIAKTRRSFLQVRGALIERNLGVRAGETPPVRRPPEPTAGEEDSRPAAPAEGEPAAPPPEEPRPEPPKPPEGEAAAPKEGPEESDRLAATGIRLERMRTMEMPYYRLKNNTFRGRVGNMIARLADQIVQIPGLRIRGNVAGYATETASVEALAAQANWRYAAAERFQAEMYFRYRGWDPKKAGPFRTRVEELRDALFRGRPEGVLSFAEFDQQVGLAIATNRHEIPEVLEAARFWRENFYEPFEREAAAAGVLLSARYRAESEAALDRLSIMLQRQLEDVRREIAARMGATDEELRAAQEAYERIPALWHKLDVAFEFLRESRERFQADPSKAARMQLAEAIRNRKEISAELSEAQKIAREWTERAHRKAQEDPVMAEWLRIEREIRSHQSYLLERGKLLSEMKERAQPYAPQNWIRSEVRARRDELVERIARIWAAEQEMHDWAPPEIRAEVAISHLLGDGIGHTVERVVRRAMIDRGMDPQLASGLAADLTKELHERVARTEPSRLRIELASLLGKQIKRTPDESIGRLVEQVLRSAEVPGRQVGGSEDDLSGLLNQILRPDRREYSEWNDWQRPGHARERTIDVPTEVIHDFLDLSQRAGAAEYARRMGAAVAMGRKFGDPSMLGRIYANQIEMLKAVARGEGGSIDELQAVTQATRDLRDRVLGTFRIPEDPDAYSVRAVRFLINNAILTQMGAGLKAQIADLGRVVMAAGFWRTLRSVMESLTRNAEGFRLGGDEAAKAGAALELVTLGRSRAFYDMASIGADHTLLERYAKSGAEMMMFLNLMAPWTQWAQRFAGALLQSDMIELSLKVAEGRASADEITRLAAFGFDAETARRVAAEWRAAGAQKHGELYLANTDAWVDGDLREVFRAALRTAVDAAVVRPGAADRPNFMSAPLGQMIFMYKGFSIAATQRILMAGLQQRDALVLSGILSSIALAWLLGDAPGGPFARHPIFSSERLFTAVERSGALGLLFDINTAVELVSRNSIGLRPLLGMDPPAYAREVNWAQQATAIGGPALAPWLTVVWALTDPDAKADQVAGAIRRTIWFQNLLYIDWLFRAVTQEAATAFRQSPPPRLPEPRLPGFMGGRQ